MLEDWGRGCRGTKLDIWSWNGVWSDIYLTSCTTETLPHTCHLRPFDVSLFFPKRSDRLNVVVESTEYKVP